MKLLQRSACATLLVIVVLAVACSKSSSTCVDRDKVAGKMDQAILLLQDGAKAASEHSASASSQLSAAASLIEGIADDLAPAPVQAGEMRVAGARMRAAIAKLQEPGGDAAAAQEIMEAAKHFKAVSAPMEAGAIPFCK